MRHSSYIKIVRKRYIKTECRSVYKIVVKNVNSQLENAAVSLIYTRSFMYKNCFGNKFHSLIATGSLTLSVDGYGIFLSSRLFWFRDIFSQGKVC